MGLRCSRSAIRARPGQRSQRKIELGVPMTLGVLRDSIAVLNVRTLTNLNAHFPKLGWRTPDTYSSNTFCMPPKSPGLYVVTLDNWETDFSRPMYVGQSRNIQNRWNGHEIIGQIYDAQSSCEAVRRWFLPWEVKTLLESERFLISSLNPSYNIIGRTRGVA